MATPTGASAGIGILAFQTRPPPAERAAMLRKCPAEHLL